MMRNASLDERRHRATPTATLPLAALRIHCRNKGRGLRLGNKGDWFYEDRSGHGEKDTIFFHWLRSRTKVYLES